MHSRRSVLGLAGVALAAGCLQTTRVADDPETEPSPADTPSPGTDGPIRTDQPPTESDVPPTTDGCASGIDVSADGFDPAADLPVDLDDAERALFEEALEAGSKTVETYAHDEPIRDGTIVTADGAFYRVRVEGASGTEVPARLVDVEWESGQTAPADAIVVDYAVLPKADRFALEYVVYGPRFQRERGHPTRGLQASDAHAPYPDGGGESQLAGDGWSWVRWNDRTYRVRVGGETTTTRYTFTFAVSSVADGPAAFRSAIAERYLVDLSDLPEDERTIVRQATDDSYGECEPASPPLADLQERLSTEETLPHPHDDAWYVAVDDRRYELTIMHWVH